MPELKLNPEHLEAIRLPLPTNVEAGLPTRSYLRAAPQSTPINSPDFTTHHNLILVATIEFLRLRNRSIVNGMGRYIQACLNEQSWSLADYLSHGGMTFFSKANEREIFRDREMDLHKDPALLATIWTPLAEMWEAIWKNDEILPWRDNMVKTCMLERCDFEFRFYLFHAACVEYFTMAILAQSEADKLSENSVFAAQEYGLWKDLMAAALLLFKERGLEQMDVMESGLKQLLELIPVIDSDIESCVQDLLLKEKGMLYHFGQLSHRQIIGSYDQAYQELAQKVCQASQELRSRSV